MTHPDWALVLLAGLPLLSGALLLAVSMFSSTRPVYGRMVRYIAQSVVGLTAASATLFLLWVGDAPSSGIEWLPGTGLMTISLSATSLYAALVTSWAAFFALIGASKPGPRYSPLSDALILFALGAGNIAFLTNHFLGRYVALETVALSVALAPLAHATDSLEGSQANGMRLSTAIYLILRVGDAGLLVAILILMKAGNTLDITAALEAGKTLDTVRLGWVTTCLVLAVWIKQGVWPAHLWLQSGQQLSTTSRAWLYAILMPNLGTYLLYRVTPLLVLSEPVRTATLWLGAGSAAVAMTIALAARARAGLDGMRTGLVHLGAAQGGLALFVAASGAKSLVWLILFVLTLPRLLILLSDDTAQHVNASPRRRVLAGAFGLSGLIVTAFGLLSVFWVQQAGIPPSATLLAQTTVALMAAWFVRSTWQLASLPPPSWLQLPIDHGSRQQRGLDIQRTRWATLGLLSCCILAGGVAWRPLIRHLADAIHGPLPPSFSLASIIAITPSLLATVVLTGGMWLLARRDGEPGIFRRRTQPRRDPGTSEQAAYGLQEGLTQVAKVLQNVIEIGIQERVLILIVRAVVGSAQWIYRVMETQFLENLQRHAIQAIVGAGHLAYRMVEQKSLEDALRQLVRTILALNRRLQRLHTGKLRYNLTWAAIALGLAVLIPILF